VMVDVGANCGLYALVAARSVGPRGRVIALEPSPREFARLQENVVLNGFTQVHCAPVAVSDVTGQVRLHIAPPPFGGHNTMAERFVQEGVVLAEARTVPSVTLDELLRDADRCDLIKLDIEGAELHALRGAAASLDRFRPALLLEVNPAMLAANGTSAADLLDWLRQRGYVVHGIDATTGALAKPVIAGERTVNVLCLVSDQ